MASRYHPLFLAVGLTAAAALTGQQAPAQQQERGAPAAIVAKPRPSRLLEEHGYKKPLWLFRDESGWVGTALRDGKIVLVRVDPQGRISEE